MGQKDRALLDEAPEEDARKSSEPSNDKNILSFLLQFV